MGKFKEYAERFDRIAKDAFKEYKEAETKLKEAQKQASANPVKTGFGVTPQMQIEAQRAQLVLKEAQEQFKIAKHNYEGKKKDISVLRKELESKVIDSLMADPANLDRNTVDVLQSGICSTDEIEKFYSKAEQAGNTLMCRWIGNFAGTEVQRIGKKLMDDSERKNQTTRLNNIRAKGLLSAKPENNTSLMAFGVMEDCFNRCVNNPSMIQHWDALTENAKENM